MPPTALENVIAPPADSDRAFAPSTVPVNVMVPLPVETVVAPASFVVPLTLAILDGQLVRVGTQVYVVPLLSIVETVQVDRERLNMITGQSPVYRLRGEAVPVVSINRVLRVREEPREGAVSERERLLVIVETGRDIVGLAVDELLEQHQVVIKSLENNFTQVPGTLGATILGDGTVSLIVDIAGLVRLSGVRTDIGTATSAAA